MRALREALDRDVFSVYEPILRALDALLRATYPPESQPSSSSKSFLAMCLRKIPDYIADLEYWEKQDAEANNTKSIIQESRVSFDIYSELESLGALGGWKHLRIVVRAHGLKIIQGAIRDGLIEDRVATTVIGLCCMYLPLVESMELINTFIARQYPPPDPFVRDGFTLKAPGLHPLWAFGLGNGNTKRFMIGKLADLFADGSLPAEWLLVGPFRTTCFDAMTKMIDGPGQDCVDFLITMVNVLSSLMSEERRKKRPAPTSCPSPDVAPPEMARQTLAGNMGLLVYLTLRHFDDPDMGMTAITPCERPAFVHRVRYIFRTYLLHAKKTAGLPSPGVYLISLCDFLAFGTESSASIVASAWTGARSNQHNQRLSEQYSITLEVLNMIVRTYSGETGASSAHTYIAHVCKKLKPLWALGNLSGQPLENIEVDLAFEVALGTNDLQDLAYAEKLWAEKKTVTHPLTMTKAEPDHKPSEGSEGNSLAGYKWDDALSEWVTVDSPEPPMAEGEGGRRTTRSSTGRLPTMGAVQRHLPTLAATPATVASASTSTSAPNNHNQTRGTTRLLRSGSTSTATLATVDNTDSNTDENDANSETTTSSTSSQTDDDADAASNSDWDSDFETSNVVGRNETHKHQQIPPRPRTKRLLEPKQQQRRLTGKRKPSPLESEDEQEEEGPDEDNDNDDNNTDYHARRHQTKRPRTRASLAAVTAAVTASARSTPSASGSGSSGTGANITRRRSLRRSTGSSTGNSCGRAAPINRAEETSEDELG